jgi:preprotein translocase subunit SecG
LEILVWAAHVVLAAILIVLVLLQHGKGADMGAAFGSGSAGSLFGASGSANFLSRATGMVAALFFATSMGLTYFSANQPKDASVMSIMNQIEETEGAPKDSGKNSIIQDSIDDHEVQGSSKANQVPE